MSPPDIHKFEHKCEICNNELIMSSKEPEENLVKYQKHLLIHLHKELFGEIPYMEKYYCPKQEIEVRNVSSSSNSASITKTIQCNEEFSNRDNFLVHLSNHHHEFYPRLLRCLRQIGEGMSPGEVISDEYKQLKAIKRSLYNKENMFNLQIPNFATSDLCNEMRVFARYEEKHGVGSPNDFLECLECKGHFKNAENAVLHLCLKHKSTFLENH